MSWWWIEWALATIFRESCYGLRVKSMPGRSRAPAVHEQGAHEHQQEYDEENPGDANGTRRDATKTESRRHQGDNEEYG